MRLIILGLLISTAAYAGQFNAYRFGNPVLWVDGADSSDESMTFEWPNITTNTNKGIAANTDFSAFVGSVGPLLAGNIFQRNSATAWAMGAGNSVLAPNSPAYNFLPSTSPWTLSLLYKQGSGGAYYEGLAQFMSDATPVAIRTYGTGFNSMLLLFDQSQSSAGGLISLGAGFTDWNLVTIIYNGCGITKQENFTARVKGVPTPITGSYTYTSPVQGTSLIGYDGTTFFSGYQMEVVIYPKALSGPTLVAYEASLMAQAGIVGAQR